MDDRPTAFGDNRDSLAFIARLPGEMPRRVAEMDWSRTPLGPPESWPQNLRLTVETVLASGFPMAVRWGPQLISIYNDAYAALLGPKHPAALGAPIDQVWPEIAGELTPLNLAILRGERPAFFEKMHLWRVQRYGVPEEARFTASYSPIPDPGVPNGIGGILVATLDTTREFRTGQRLRELTERLEDEVLQRTRERDRIWQVSEDLLGVGNFEGYYLSVNPAWSKLLGWSDDELKRMHVEELRHPEDAPAARAGRAQLQAGVPQVRMENRFRHKDGTWRWLNWTLATEAGLIYVIGRDITADREIAQRIHDSERDFRTLVGAVTDYAIFRLTPDGMVATWNAGAERAHGYSSHEIVGRNFKEFYTPEDQAVGLPQRVLAQAARDGRAEIEGWRVRKDGSRFWANVVIDAIYGDAGVLAGFAKITRDITEWREAQVMLERTQEQLAQAHKMDALGQLTGGIAHDFNNMLMVVGGYIQYLKPRLKEPKEIRAIDALEYAANRAEKLTRQLLTFSRRQSLNRTTVRLPECFDAFHEILATTAKGNVNLDISIPADTWPVTIDVNEFEVAIINLIVNARDAMPNGGRIGIGARNETIDERNAVEQLRGEFVTIEIEDEGGGIAAEHLPKVFDPFFTTKGAEKGTGLGLSQVYGFAHQAGGAVTVTSEIGRGTRVTLYLPRSREPLTAATDDSPGLPGGSETVLLVEDNAEVQAVAASMLEQLGYTVIIADSATEALDVLDGGDSTDLVLTDIVMPGALDGMALARHVKAHHAGISVLLTTGYSKEASDPRSPFPVLRKPYQLPAMARAVRHALDHG